jgi:Cytoskeletal-regulatory complex EF hand
MSAPPQFNYLPARHERVGFVFGLSMMAGCKRSVFCLQCFLSIDSRYATSHSEYFFLFIPLLISIQAYYGALFQAADTERSGSIAGARAVEFFTKSKVPIAILKQIWTASDQPPTNSLDARKFAVAVRLIQLEQNGIKPGFAGPNLTNVPPSLRPVFFEGIPVPPPGAGPGPGPAQQQQSQHPPPGGGGMHPMPPRPPAMSSGGSVAGSVVSMTQQQQYQNHQLAVQDPYTLTPAEQARYEQIFPDYCKQEPGFMHGEEAIGLFGKSGLAQEQLAAIWNMVDVPVDNKLDKLEFAMAMHLIVCVSKKNLPLPGGLPISLKQLKVQQQQQLQQQRIVPSPSMDGGSLAGRQQPQTQEFSSSRSLASAGPGIPSLERQPRMGVGASMMGGSGMGGIPASTGQTQPSVGVQMMSGEDRTKSNFSGISGLPGPPPLSQQTGGVSISDAFEGLDGVGDTGSISSFGASNQVPSSVHYSSSYDHQQHTTVETVPEDDPVEHSRTREPAPTPEPPKTIAQLASSYDMGEAKDELEKLRAILQKLQAENISIKAKLGVMGDEEKDIQRELSATVAEISKLSSELTTLRAQMLASKSRLLEAAAEFKAAKEKKGYV